MKALEINDKSSIEYRVSEVGYISAIKYFIVE